MGVTKDCRNGMTNVPMLKPDKFSISKSLFCGCRRLIRQAMDEICFSPFVLSFRSLGFFRRDDGDIWFARADECVALIRLQSELHNALLKRGFRLERRKYRPHVTLARRAVLDEQVLPSPAFSAEVTSFSLMLSEQERQDGVYAAVYCLQQRFVMLCIWRKMQTGSLSLQSCCKRKRCLVYMS